jgi:adenylate cyclase, class 2
MKEIEILIEVKDSKDKVLEKLSQFEKKGLKMTLDVYYYDPLREDLKPSDTGRLNACFRLRSKDGKCTVAYKVDHFDGETWSHSDEYETEVGDLETAEKIVEKLGLKELVRIDNEKHTFTTSEYEIVLEDVKELGLYMEVEKLEEVPDDKVQEAKGEIREFLQSLDIRLGEEQNAGKPELMLRKLGVDLK